VVDRSIGTAALVEQAVARFGGVDVLVNNVGMAKGAGLVDTPDAAWQEALDYTLYPAVRASRAAVPHMIRRGGGSIVLIASIFGREAGGRLTYNVVKAAEISLGKALARELGQRRVHPRRRLPGPFEYLMHCWLAAGLSRPAAGRPLSVRPAIYRRAFARRPDDGSGLRPRHSSRGARRAAASARGRRSSRL